MTGVKRKRKSFERPVVSKCPKIDGATANCPVCLENNIPEEKKCYLDRCLHQFCVACVRKLPQKSCPMCRTPFSKAYFNIRSAWDFDILSSGSEDAAHSCILCEAKSLAKYFELMEDFFNGPCKSIIKKLEEGTPICCCRVQYFIKGTSTLRLFVLASKLKKTFGNKINLKTFSKFGSSVFEKLKLELEELIRNYEELGELEPNFSINLLLNHLNIMAPWNCEFLEVLQLAFGCLSYRVLKDILELFQKSIAKMPKRKRKSERMRRQIDRLEDHRKRVIRGQLAKDPQLWNFFVRDKFQPLSDYLKRINKERSN